MDLGNGEWEVRTIGNDPYFFLKAGGAPIDLREQPIFAFECLSTTALGRVLIFVGPAIDVPHMVELFDLGRSEGWAQPSVDLTATFKPVAAP